MYNSKVDEIDVKRIKCNIILKNAAEKKSQTISVT